MNGTFFLNCLFEQSHETNANRSNLDNQTTSIGCMPSILCCHIFKKLSLQKVYISSSHDFFITSTFTLWHLAMEGKRKAEAGSSKDSKAARCVATPVRSTGVDKPNCFCCRFVTLESRMMLDVRHHEMVR